MTHIQPQVVAAISGALAAYLAEEEAAQMAAVGAAAVYGPPGPPPNLWGMSGRTQAMQLRLLVQRRSLK